MTNQDRISNAIANAFWLVVLGVALILGAAWFGLLAAGASGLGGQIGYGFVALAALVWSGSCFEAAVDHD